MNLTDKETLELNGLCGALADGAITPPQHARLSQMLAASEDARRFYVRYSGLSASLFDYAGEMQSERPDAVRAPARALLIRFPRFAIGSLAAAAALVIASGLWFFSERETAEAANDADTEELVARLTGTHDCVWAGGLHPQPGANIHLGQVVELEKGVAEITFDSGAQLLLQGPAALEVASPWEAVLRHGTLRASVPAEAVGFHILHPSVDVVDLGTEFSMTADESGHADVYVIKGAVQTTAHNTAADQKPLLLHESQSRRFGPDGAAEISGGALPLASVPPMNRIASALRFIHWSFDEAEGPAVRADQNGLAAPDYDATIDAPQTGAELAPLRTAGRTGGALNLDGTHSAHVTFRGISANTPRTVAFWLKVPADARLTESRAAIAWLAAGAKKNALQPLQIGWNSEPSQGALGALRVDFRRGSVIGTGDLRDGRWHHIAIVLVPNERANGSLHIRNYVDGHLEHTRRLIAKKQRHGRADQPRPEAHLAGADTLWLGRAPGRSAQSGEFFRGSLDELYVADSALSPQDIKQLMNGGTVSQQNIAAVAAAGPQLCAAVSAPR